MAILIVPSDYYIGKLDKSTIYRKSANGNTPIASSLDHETISEIYDNIFNGKYLTEQDLLIDIKNKLGK